MAGGERARAASISARHGALYPHHFPKRFPALLDPTYPRKVPSALVWRHARRLDHLHALLSVAAACGLRLRPPSYHTPRRPGASADARLDPAFFDRLDAVPC